jgi:hypothetical protein
VLDSRVMCSSSRQLPLINGSLAHPAMLNLLLRR